MEIKRILTAIIGFPIVAAILILGNIYVVDITLAVVAVMGLYEYFHAFEEQRDKKALRIVPYIMAVSIAFLHVIKPEYIDKAILFAIPISVLVLFTQIIITNMKYNIKDISIALFGICYVVLFTAFLSLIRALDNGQILIWYVFVTAWGTDIFAYSVGRRIGEHKFSTISPNKSIEGCIGGVVGALVIALVFTFVCNSVWNLNINYLYISIIAILLSIIGQLGDFAASSIKRYAEIKDFSNIFPGHGGMLDRIDSVLFIAPFAYILLSLIA